MSQRFHDEHEGLDGMPTERLWARWRWLYVPFGHALLMFIVMSTWWRLAPPATQADSIIWAAKESLFQGGVLLVFTALLLWALPRILVRHAVYIALASTACRNLVDLVAIQIYGPTTNNGERLDRTVASCVVVLLVSSLIIRMTARIPPEESLERTHEN